VNEPWKTLVIWLIIAVLAIGGTLRFGWLGCVAGFTLGIIIPFVWRR
jgi:hypothetical protein